MKPKEQIGNVSKKDVVCYETCSKRMKLMRSCARNAKIATLRSDGGLNVCHKYITSLKGKSGNQMRLISDFCILIHIRQGVTRVVRLSSQVEETALQNFRLKDTSSSVMPPLPVFLIFTSACAHDVFPSS